MKKLVLKTALFTLCGILLLSAITYGLIALFSPITLARMYDGVGNYSTSMHYYEKAYQKSNSIADLFVICAKVDAKNDSVRANIYLELFVEDGDFNAFCQAQDSGKVEVFSKTEDFYYGKYVLAVYYNDGKTYSVANAISKCNQKVSSLGYYQNNPYSFLVSYALSSFSQSDVEALTLQIQPYATTNSYAQLDLQLLSQTQS